MPTNLLASAKDVVVAKARFLERAFWLGGRHGAGITSDVFITRVEIIEVKRGSPEIGQVFDVRMGQRV